MLPTEYLRDRGQQIWDKYFVLESDFFLDQEDVEDPKVNPKNEFLDRKNLQSFRG